MPNDCIVVDLKQDHHSDKMPNLPVIYIFFLTLERWAGFETLETNKALERSGVFFMTWRHKRNLQFNCSFHRWAFLLCYRVLWVHTAALLKIVSLSYSYLKGYATRKIVRKILEVIWCFGAQKWSFTYTLKSSFDLIK